VQQCIKKNVLHIGCADAPFTRSRFLNHTLLHSQIGRVARKLAGVDVDREAIEWLASQGVQDLFQGDAANIEDILPKVGFVPDIVVAGEVLEHLLQPADFLRSIKRSMNQHTELIISVPNAFSLFDILNMLLGSEKIHPEHIAYYSYHTIVELLRRAGLQTVTIFPYRRKSSTWRDRLFRLLFGIFLWMRPHFSSGYVVTACLRTDP
jgi:2-polyprenyl-3-methyl-5-hydroxy-6-metoxy-1,4-benzoquinol methylase